MEPLAEEESDISLELGRMLRVVLGAQMQLKESADRKRYTASRETQGQESHRGRELAWALRAELGSPVFWERPGSEAVADRMTVAAQLAPDHEQAARAYMVGADRLRTGFGINIEDINRDHPTSAADRHAALRAALDDYLAGQRALAEAVETTATAEQELPEPGAKVEPSVSEPQQDAGEGETLEGASLVVEKSDTEALARFFTDRDNEYGHLVEAEIAGSEERADAMHALTQESLGDQAPGQEYERVNGLQREVIGDQQLAAVRERQGKSFPQSTSERINASSAGKRQRPKGNTFSAARYQENFTEVSR